MRLRRVLVAVAISASAAACVSPATTDGAYRVKAQQTAEDATSAIRTALLAVDNRTRMTRAYLEVLLVESEEALGSIHHTFELIQPPDTEAADELREQVVDLLDEAGGGLVELRVAARRDDLARLTAEADRLAPVAEQLDRLAQDLR